MSVANKNLVRRYIDQLINFDHWEHAPSILAANFVLHHRASPDPVVGREAFREYAEKFRTSFPDLQATVEDIFTDGDTVIVRVVWTGTHLSEFEEIPPTRRSFSLAGTGIYRIADHLIVEAWAEYDPLELLHQLAGVRGTDQLPQA